MPNLTMSLNLFYWVCTKSTKESDSIVTTICSSQIDWYISLCYHDNRIAMVTSLPVHSYF